MYLNTFLQCIPPLINNIPHHFFTMFTILICKKAYEYIVKKAIGGYEKTIYLFYTNLQINLMIYFFWFNLVLVEIL